MSTTTQIQRDAIKLAIQIELKKRGYFAPIVSLEEVISKNSELGRITFITEEFQTTPVMFEFIRIANFSSSIFAEEHNEKQFYNIFIQVNLSWDSFSGGSNELIYLTFVVF